MSDMSNSMPKNKPPVKPEYSADYFIIEGNAANAWICFSLSLFSLLLLITVCAAYFQNLVSLREMLFLVMLSIISLLTMTVLTIKLKGIRATYRDEEYVIRPLFHKPYTLALSDITRVVWKNQKKLLVFAGDKKLFCSLEHDVGHGHLVERLTRDGLIT